MGAWSHTSFGNDSARDFLYDVEEDAGAIEGAISAIEAIAAGDYIDADFACNVLAAGELLAAAHGKPPQDYPEEARVIVATLKPNAQLRFRAAQAITRILDASGLRNLWEEGDSPSSDWTADVRGLLERLK
jgi:Domain of unknown function (DUF4259)